MIKAFILYFLNIKPTHGYEIQKYIQMNHMDSWTKIQSGSIYYALSKLEKEALIILYKEEKIGAKTRKIYKITEEGKEALKKYLEEEISKMIYETGSDKFIIYSLVGVMDKEVLINDIRKHLKMLNTKKAELEKWEKIKVNKDTLKIEAVCFNIMISNVNNQIKWHEVLLEEIDDCINISEQMSDVIKKVDFTSVNDLGNNTKINQKQDIEKLKKEILKNPDEAAEKLEQLIEILKSK
jgi:DNA-binding PadR family transcriptional regulator